jgi:hypothetical protein
MLKNTIIATLFLQLSLTAFGASKLKMSHSDFLHLSDSQKNTFILKVMELSIELESRYKHETARNGFNQQRFDRYTKIFHQLNSALFISDAYAVTDGEDTCVFAGWISRAVKKNGQTICSHPDSKKDENVKEQHSIDGIIPKESFQYPAPKLRSSCHKDGTKMVQCNPLIFGHKKLNTSDQSLSTLFCVQAKDGAENSSYECMEEALDSEKAPDQDSMADRLSYMRKNLSESEKNFNDVREFTLNHCLCPPGSTSENAISPSHKTCYDLIEMMVSPAEACERPENFRATDTSDFEFLQDSLLKKILSEGNPENSYSAIISPVQKANPDEYAAACGPRPEVIDTENNESSEISKPASKYVCEANCESFKTEASPETEQLDVSKIDYACSFTLRDENDKNATPTFETVPTEKPQKLEDTTLLVKNNIAKKEVQITCALKVTPRASEDKITNDSDPTLHTSINCGRPEAKTCKVTAIKKGGSNGWAIKWNIKNLAQGETVSIGPDLEAEVVPSQNSTAEASTSATSSDSGTNKVSTVVQSKTKSSYEVCAVLEKEDKKIPQGGSCKTIPALFVKQAPDLRPSVTGQMGAIPQPPPQTQIRGASDTSAMGIK